MDVSGDKVFAKMGNRTCMQFTRSHFNCRSSTQWGEQFNGVTSFLDGSTVYGSSESKAKALRGGDARRKDGKLWVSNRLKDFKIPQRFDLGELRFGCNFVQF